MILQIEEAWSKRSATDKTLRFDVAFHSRRFRRKTKRGGDFGKVWPFPHRVPGFGPNLGFRL